MPGINHAVWTKDRIIAYKKYLNGAKAIEYRGVKTNGQPYKRSVPVAKLISRNSSYTYSVAGSKLMVDDGDRKREVLSTTAVESLVRRLYKNKAIALGKTPSIYNWMKIRYVGFGYTKVHQIMKSIPEYQKYQARHLQKKKSRAIIISHAPGENIDADLMFFSKKYYKPSHNDNNQGLLVVVDRFSGYIAVRPVKFGEKGKSADVVSRQMESIIRQAGFPRSRGATVFTDNGSEFQQVYQERMRQLGYNHVIISQSAGAPSPHAERAVGILRKLINQKLSAGAQAPKALSQSWWPMARTLVQSYNDTPMTDSRGPETPNQLKGFRGARAKAVVRRMQASGAKRLGMKKNARKGPGGAKVQKTLAILQVGDHVRAALEKLRKTGAMKRPWPKQRWSSKVYRVAKVISRKIGFARYTLGGLPRQRWEREDLQVVKRLGARKLRRGEQPGGNDETEQGVSRQSSKLSARYDPEA
jgi:hypothetical protein